MKNCGNQWVQYISGLKMETAYDKKIYVNVSVRNYFIEILVSMNFSKTEMEDEKILLLFFTTVYFR